MLMFLLLAAPAFARRTPTPTYTPQIMPTALPDGSGASGPVGTFLGYEPAVAVSPAGDRAITQALSGLYGRYTIADGTAQLESIGRLPVSGCDASVVWGPDGIVHAATFDMVGAHDTSSRLLVFNSPDAGATWSAPVTVAEYVGPTFPDFEHLAVSRLSGRLWMTWSEYFSALGGKCIATSIDSGQTWSPCYHIAGLREGYNILWVAATGADTALVVWPGPVFRGVRCRGIGPNVYCDSYSRRIRPAVWDRLDPGFGEMTGQPLRIGMIGGLAANEATGEAALAYSSRDPVTGLARIVMTRKRGPARWRWLPLEQLPSVVEDHCAQPAIAALADGGWLATYYQHLPLTDAVRGPYVFQVYATLQQPGFGWSMPIPIGDEIRADEAGWLGDFASLACATDRNMPCVAAWTGSFAQNGPWTNWGQIAVAVIPQTPPTPTPLPTRAPPPLCCGDCDGDFVVAEWEFDTCIAIDFATTPLSDCPQCDCDSSGVVGATDLQGAINSKINGCP